ncbi:unnamed protein product [Cuscuta epithymum]|uniref:Uncharacterized protein n=1 Tax=Cuscuta epithymum TaxID=186058 RepID=A0AAV0F468_9ASTE|nr:unnamed protein product [Cuscuta epithymum]
MVQIMSSCRSDQTIQPRRGHIKARILRTLVNSASELVSFSVQSKTKRKDVGPGTLSPDSYRTPTRTTSRFDFHSS